MKKLTILALAFTAMSNAFSQNAISLDGIDDHIATDYQGILGNSPRTMEAWINTSNTVADQRVILDYGNFGLGSFDNGERFTLNLNATFQLRIEIRGWGMNATTALNDGQWHHVAVSYDGTTMRLYVDGIEEANGIPSIPVNTTTNTDLLIGMRTDINKYFEGAIDEVRFWNDVRTPSEILANMNAEICTMDPSLTAYFQLNEGMAGQNNAGMDSCLNIESGSYADLLGFDLTGSTSNWVLGSGITTGMSSTTQTFSECDGFSITVGTNTYNQTGQYTDVLSSVGGCDSIIYTNLFVEAPITSSQSFTECSGFTVTVGGNTYSQTGVYTDVLTSVISGCDSTVTTDLTINTIDTSITQNANVLLANHGGAVYQWLDCESGMANVNGETSATFSASTGGTYAVMITDGACVDTSSCRNVSFVGLNDFGFDQTFIYPNPAQNAINIDTDEQIESISIVNLAGELVLSVSNNISKQLDISSLASGSYLIKLNSKNDSRVIRIIKQ